MAFATALGSVARWYSEKRSRRLISQPTDVPALAMCGGRKTTSRDHASTSCRQTHLTRYLSTASPTECTLRSDFALLRRIRCNPAFADAKLFQISSLDNGDCSICFVHVGIGRLLLHCHDQAADRDVLFTAFQKAERPQLTVQGLIFSRNVGSSFETL